jgi:predicted permease
MELILSSLVPVFGLIFLGAYLQRRGFLDSAMESLLNRLSYWICLPVFIVWKTAMTPPLGTGALHLSAALLLVTLGLMALGWITAHLLRIPKRSLGTFLHAVLRGNLAYIGLPVIFFAMRDQPESLRAETGSLAILAMTPLVLLYNLLGVMVLEWDRRGEHTSHPFRAWLRSTQRNPLVIACLVGLAWNRLSIPFPALLEATVAPLGQAAFPLALIAIGARIATISWKKKGLSLFGVCLVKNVLAIPLSLAVCAAFGFEGPARIVLLVLGATPTAVASYVLVDQLDGDRGLGAAAIAATTLASLPGLALAVWLSVSP